MGRWIVRKDETEGLWTLASKPLRHRFAAPPPHLWHSPKMERILAVTTTG